MAVNSQSKGTDGFFGTVAGALQDGLVTGLQQSVPVWTANILGVQSQDQLAQPVYDEQPVSDGGAYIPEPIPAVLDGNSFNIDATAVMIGAAAIIGVLVVARGL